MITKNEFYDQYKFRNFKNLIFENSDKLPFPCLVTIDAIIRLIFLMKILISVNQVCYFIRSKVSHWGNIGTRFAAHRKQFIVITDTKQSN